MRRLRRDSFRIFGGDVGATIDIVRFANAITTAAFRHRFAILHHPLAVIRVFAGKRSRAIGRARHSSSRPRRSARSRRYPPSRPAAAFDPRRNPSLTTRYPRRQAGRGVIKRTAVRRRPNPLGRNHSRLCHIAVRSRQELGRFSSLSGMAKYPIGRSAPFPALHLCINARHRQTQLPLRNSSYNRRRHIIVTS